MMHIVGLQGLVRLLQYRHGMLIRDYTVCNKIIWDAKVDILNKFFKATGTWTNFYVGILKDPGTLWQENEPSLASLYAEEFKTYTEGTRQQIIFENANKADDGSYVFIQNSSSNYCVFNVDTGVTNQIIKGVYVVGQNTKNVQPTLCWCTAAFGNNDAAPEEVTINSGDILRIQYTVRIPKA